MACTFINFTRDPGGDSFRDGSLSGLYDRCPEPGTAIVLDRRECKKLLVNLTLFR